MRLTNRLKLENQLKLLDRLGLEACKDKRFQQNNFFLTMGKQYNKLIKRRRRSPIWLGEKRHLQSEKPAPAQKAKSLLRPLQSLPVARKRNPNRNRCKRRKRWRKSKRRRCAWSCHRKGRSRRERSDKRNFLCRRSRKVRLVGESVDGFPQAVFLLGLMLMGKLSACGDKDSFGYGKVFRTE